MLIFTQHRIYRSDLESNRNILYIFGDNLERLGCGGQAGEMRDEPNAIGIATKRGIGHVYNNEDYFLDAQDDVIPILTKEFDKLHEAMRSGKYDALCIPSDGIGTGLSRMPEFAPKALEWIEEQFRNLYVLFKD